MLIKKSSNVDANVSDDLKNLYYHIFDNVNELNEQNVVNNTMTDKLDSIDIKDLEDKQDDFINFYEEYNKEYLDVDVIMNENEHYFNIPERNKEGQIPKYLSKMLKKYFGTDILFSCMGVPRDNSIFYALLMLLDKAFAFSSSQDLIIQELKQKLLFELSGDKLFSFFKIYKLKMNLEGIYGQFNKNIISDAVIFIIEKYFNVNFLIYDVENRYFVDRNIHKLGNFHILLKFNNIYYPVINNRNIIINNTNYESFLTTLPAYNALVGTEIAKQDTPLSKMKISELIDIAKERNIEYQYVDDKQKKLKTLLKKDLLKKLQPR